MHAAASPKRNVSMKLALAISLSLCGTANAQLMNGITSSVNYQGPGDTSAAIASAGAFWSVRGYNHAYTLGGQKAMNLRRASDNGTKDIVILPNGKLDVTTANSFCNATTCFFTKWVDQTGNGNDATQGTAGNQPQFLATGGPSSLPTASYNGTTSLLVSGGQTSVNQPYTFAAVSNRTGNTTNGNGVISTFNGSTGAFLEYTNVATDIDAYAGTYFYNTGNETETSWHNLLAVLNGNSSIISVDNIALTGQAGGAQTLGTTGFSLGGINGASPLTGAISEVVYYPSGLNSTQYGNLCHNQFTAFGTATSC